MNTSLRQIVTLQIPADVWLVRFCKGQ